MGASIVQFRGNKTILGYIKDGQAYASNISDKNLQYLKDRIHIAYLLYIEKNEDEAVSLKKNTFADGWLDNAGSLNSFSWWCFENQINLDEAAVMARRGVKLAEPGGLKANILDTLAEVVFLQGKTDEAIVLMEEAIRENPKNKYFQEQLDRFQKELASMTN